MYKKRIVVMEPNDISVGLDIGTTKIVAMIGRKNEYDKIELLGLLVDADGPWVLSVAMKDPPSITLSLPVMANARQVVVAACGVSEKYPQGKSDGMRRAVAAEDETLTTFPAVGLRGSATWIMDEAAGSKLGDDYLK